MYRKLNMLGLLGLSVLLIWTSRPSAQTTTTPMTTGAPTTTTSPTQSSTTTGSGFTGVSTPASTSTTGRTTGGITGSTSTLTGSGGAAGRTAGTGTSSQIPTQYNSYQTYYYNPIYSGLPTKYNASSPARNYGQPLFATQTAATVTTGPGISTAATTAVGYTSLSVRRSPNYTTALSEELRIVRPALVRANVQDIIDRSTVLSSKSGITVDVQGPVVVLRGEVATVKDRRIAEGMLRMTPGVLDVVNELRVK